MNILPLIILGFWKVDARGMASDLIFASFFVHIHLKYRNQYHVFRKYQTFVLRGMIHFWAHLIVSNLLWALGYYYNVCYNGWRLLANTTRGLATHHTSCHSKMAYIGSRVPLDTLNILRVVVKNTGAFKLFTIFQNIPDPHTLVSATSRQVGSISGPGWWLHLIFMAFQCTATLEFCIFHNKEDHETVSRKNINFMTIVPPDRLSQIQVVASKLVDDNMLPQGDQLTSIPGNGGGGGGWRDRESTTVHVNNIAINHIMHVAHIIIIIQISPNDLQQTNHGLG